MPDSFDPNSFVIRNNIVPDLEHIQDPDSEEIVTDEEDTDPVTTGAAISSL